MNTAKLSDMTGGWFIGNFEPSLQKTNDVEVAVKQYSKGQSEKKHHHKIATEYSVIISGTVEILGKTFQAGDIIIVQPNESIDFKAITEVTTVVVKLPGAQNDKYIDEV